MIILSYVEPKSLPWGGFRLLKMEKCTSSQILKLINIFVIMVPVEKITCMIQAKRVVKKCQKIRKLLRWEAGVVGEQGCLSMAGLWGSRIPDWRHEFSVEGAQHSEDE